MKKGVELPSLWWTPIDGYEGLYKASIDGDVKSLKWGKERVLKPWKGKDGYLRVNLCKDGKCKKFLVHRLVAQTWIPNPNSLPCINHINEDKTDNRVENLEWVTPKENINWGTHNERVAKANTNGKCSKPVIALDIQGRIVYVFPSTHEAERNGYDHSAVSACCRGDKYYKTYKGLIWRYQDDFLKDVC